MQGSRVWLGFLVVWSVVGLAQAEEALSFVAGVNGAAWVVRAGGSREAATLGAQLYRGDVLEVEKGRASVIDLSGRSSEIAAGQRYQPEGEGKPSALMGRLMDTLGEVAGPAGGNAEPMVHGMARDLESISGARPANTLLWQGDFVFSWDPALGAETYELILESLSGEVLSREQLKGNQVPASRFPLKTGQRYVWSVQTVGAALAMKSAKSWVEVVSEKRGGETRKAVDKLVKEYPREAAGLLKAAFFLEQGFYDEAERWLLACQQQRPLSPMEQRLLDAARTKMESPGSQPEQPR